MLKLRPLRQSGDTIVEVLIVLAVLGFAIGIAYSTANRSLKQARSAQENGEVTEMLQGQIEAIRVMAPNAKADPAQNVLQAGPYCIRSSAPDAVTKKITSKVQLTSAPVGPSDPPACTYGTDNRYSIAIRYNTTARVFTLVGSWDDVEGFSTKNTVTLVYRL